MSESNKVKYEWTATDTNSEDYYKKNYNRWRDKGKLTALIDGDMLPYIVGFCCSPSSWEKVQSLAYCCGLKEGTNKWFKFIKKHKLSNLPVGIINDVLNSWVTSSGADSAKVYLTGCGRDGYRDRLAFSRQYKGSRKSKPPFHSFLVWYLKKYHDAIVSVNNEADDLMSIEQYQSNEGLSHDGLPQGSSLSKKFSKTVIVTKDKDLRMIAGWHSNPDIKDGKKFWVDYLGWLDIVYKQDCNTIKKVNGAGVKFFYFQMLVGDVVDNYVGLPSYGQVKAYNLLNDAKSQKECESIVKKEYIKVYGKKKTKRSSYTGEIISTTWKDHFVEQGRLAWMQRKNGDVFKNSHKLVKIKQKQGD